MRIEFADDDLRRLFEDRQSRDPRLDQDIVRAFRRKVVFLQNALNEQDLYAQRSLHFEKLKGKRAHHRSIRLNDQWRLILELVTDDDGRLVIIIAIEDYH